MSGKTVSSFGVEPMTTHAWSGDCRHIALSRNNSQVEVYQDVGNAKWKKLDALSQHDLRVTSIDWAPKTNRIVTCSVDRNAYVWSQNADGKWEHTLVLLRINRAATCVKWSPEENKFAAGSGSRVISICSYSSENNWWVSKHIKKTLTSTITSLDWHPNNVLVAAGTTSFKVHVFSAFVREMESKPSATPWGLRMSFGQSMAEFSNSPNEGGWVHCVSFSPSGNMLAWVGHDSSISVANAGNDMSVCKLKTNYLPLLSCVWISEAAVVAGGHDCAPMVFSVDAAGVVKFQASLDEPKKEEEHNSDVVRAMQRFRNLDKQGRSELTDIQRNTVHQNAISCVRVRGRSGDGSASSVSTSAGDGKLVTWNLPTLASKIANLKL